MQILFFEGENTKQLQPITLTRQACDIRCAGTTLRELVDGMAGKGMLVVDETLVPDAVVIAKLATAVKAGKSFRVMDGKDIVVAYIAEGKLKKNNLVQQVKALKLPEKKLTLHRFAQLADIITYHLELLESNISILSKSLRKLKKDIYVGKNVVIDKTAVLDISNGAIIIGDNSKIGPQAVLKGPIVIGKKTTINPHALLIGPVAIGDVCKVGGEVGESIIQGYSNKQHYGCLGHSYVGEWVNLGGGTTNSDLKNTYGEVKMQGKKTGRQFLGCIIGDGTKTSIGTMIYTGKVIGVHSMLFGEVTRDVPSFTNAGTLVKSWVEIPVSIATHVQQAVMERRKLKFTGEDKKTIQYAYDATRAERKTAKVARGKLVLR